ncbi:hypothetical protein ACJX0J_005709 [Zea mays]
MQKQGNKQENHGWILRFHLHILKMNKKPKDVFKANKVSIGVVFSSHVFKYEISFLHESIQKIFYIILGWKMQYLHGIQNFGIWITTSTIDRKSTFGYFTYYAYVACCCMVWDNFNIWYILGMLMHYNKFMWCSPRTFLHACKLSNKDQFSHILYRISSIFLIKYAEKLHAQRIQTFLHIINNNNNNMLVYINLRDASWGFYGQHYMIFIMYTYVDMEQHKKLAYYTVVHQEPDILCHNLKPNVWLIMEDQDGIVVATRKGQAHHIKGKEDYFSKPTSICYEAQLSIFFVDSFGMICDNFNNCYMEQQHKKLAYN